MSKLVFRKPELKDIEDIRNAFKYIKHNTCDYTPANIYLWSNVYHTEIAIEGKDLYIKYKADGETYFTFPFVNRYIKDGIENLKEYASEKGLEFKMGIIEPEMFAIIEKLYPGKCSVEYDRDSADYVYDIQDLVNLSGKKFHGKKNHINKFKKTYDNWYYESISDENAEESIDMIREWCVENNCSGDKSKSDEICVMINGIKNRKELSLKGGLIRANGRIVALTLGEEVNEEMFVIHFEKAFAGVQGAYPMINQQFIQHELMDYKYVNREEDMGLEGLRKAKESYNPVFMEQKGVVIIK